MTPRKRLRYSEHSVTESLTRTEAKEMLTVDDYGAIRRARRDGKSIRQIARDFNHSRNTIRLILQHPEPNPSPRNYSAPVLGSFQALIDQILVDDEDAPPKQRHTAMQVFRRLRDEHGYPGCYGQVQRYLLKHQHKHKETFIPLGHLPGQRLEADFGHIHVDFPDGRRQIPFLVTAWAYSNAPFVLALPFERTEAILEGMVRAFEFFGCVLKEVWWDNPRTVATLILQGRERRLHPRHAELASHYVFDLLFCMPARGKEKPDAEGTVADPRPASSRAGRAHAPRHHGETRVTGSACSQCPESSGLSSQDPWRSSVKRATLISYVFPEPCDPKGIHGTRRTNTSSGREHRGVRIMGPGDASSSHHSI